jgi:probable HAF family extracellular repeat protein
VSLAYTLVDLGALGPGGSLGFDLNGRGDVTGLTSVSSTTTHAFLFNVATPFMQDLGTLGGAYSQGRGINDSQQIVGSARVASGAEHATLWNGGVPTDIDPFGGNFSVAEAISDTGQVVGYAINPQSSRRAFLWSAGVAKDLGTLGGPYSDAVDVNRAGEVAGNSYVDDQVIHSFHWSQAQGMHDISLPGGRWSRAMAINESGTIVGEHYNTALQRRPFIWKAATGIVDLHPLWGMLPYDVNYAEEIVGEMPVTTSAYSHAFHWKAGVLTDLNDAITPGSGWELLTASAINRNGQITGRGLVQGRPRAFRLDPKMMGGGGLTRPYKPIWIYQHVVRGQAGGPIIIIGPAPPPPGPWFQLPSGESNLAELRQMLEQVQELLRGLSEEPPQD